MFSTCAHNMVNFDPLTAEISWRVRGTPANINGFRVLPSLLQRRRSPEANQTLYDVWPSPWLLQYIFVFGGSCPLTKFCPVQNSLYVQVLRSYILAASLHGTPAAGASQTLRRGTMNGITEPSQRAPPIFGRAAIKMCCTRLAGNTGNKKSPKIRHMGTIAQVCRAISSQLRHVSTIGKKTC